MAARPTILERLSLPVDAESVVAFRILFGTLMSLSAVRFLVKGSVDRWFVEPAFFFKFWGFAWVEAGSRTTMIALYVAMVVLGACIASGFLYRAATIAFFGVFTYVHFIDVTNYLNHYHLVSLVSLLLFVVPANQAFSIDARLGIASRSSTVPCWSLGLLRFQVGIVYVFAAIAKMQSDWVLYAEPVEIWMNARSEAPIVGALLARHDVALIMSWAGLLNDLLAVPLLLARRTRPFGFAMIVVFHAATSYLFNIGIFPILMPIGALLFFEPSWPSQLRARFRALSATLAARFGRSVGDGASRQKRAAADQAGEGADPAEPRPRAASRGLALALGLYALVQIAMPLRTFAYGGNVLWHEQGMRFSWRVMLRKKNGSITYRVRIPGARRDVDVHPRRYLNGYQEREFAGQPDLVLQLAHHIHDDFLRQGRGDVEVRVDAWVSLNGRPPARMIDPDVDLARIRDGLSRADYILPAPPHAPARLATR